MERGSVQPAKQAEGLLYGIVNRQAMMLSFIDAFWMLAMFFLVMIPLMFLMKKTTPAKGEIVVE